MNERENIQADIIEARFAKYFFRFLGGAAVGLTVAGNIYSIKHGDFSNVDVVMDIAMVAASATLIPSERHATHSMEAATVQLHHLDNRG